MFRGVAAILLPALVSAAVFNEEDGVLILTRDNFDEAIKTHKHIMVEFYAPWCGYCQEFAPEYVKAAALLAEAKSSAKLAKVDCDAEEYLADTNGIERYPTLIFFENTVPIEYPGDTEAEELVDWVIERQELEDALKHVQILTTAENIKEFKSKHERTLIAFCTDSESPLVKMFTEVASTVENHAFGLVQDAALFNSSDAEDNTIYLYKQKRIGVFDLPEVEYSGGNSVEELQDFITSELVPALIEMNEANKEYTLNFDVKAHVLIFVSKNNGEFETSAEGLMDLANEYKKKSGGDKSKSITFLVVDTDEADHEVFMTILGLGKGSRNHPVVRIIELHKKQRIVKFRPEQDTPHYLEPDDVKKFIDDYLDGKLKRYYLAEELPKDWDKDPVKVLVSSNFKKIAFDKAKTVLVEFYSPYCGYCIRFAPIYDQLGKVFAEKFDGGKDVVIAKMNGLTNELEDNEILYYPTIRLYKKTTNEVVEFDGDDRTLEALVKFVETEGKSNGKDKVETQDDETLHSKDEL